MNKSRKSYLLALIALLLAVGIWAGVRAVDVFLRQPLVLNQVLELEVPKGSSLGPVVRKLGADKVLQHPNWLLAYARVMQRGHQIHAGDYLVGPGTTPLDLLNMLERGQVRTYSVTLVEGWTLAQARAMLAREPRLQQTLRGVPNDQLLAALDIGDAPTLQPEGLFFPDTYVFTGQTADRDILRQAYRRMQDLLAREWPQRIADLPYQSPYEALIMASIVEKETGVPAERPDIAGVFVRRLQQSMLLQTDPTVIYGLGEHYDGNLRRRDLDDAANVFNTYARAGLPPTPIALPGAAAIRAALRPNPGNALYFVARGDGSHQFSATLDEHVRAVKKYQIEQRRADYRSRAQP
ncbi:MAG: endolytic transglycosylase MltG [Spongiibacteraceae bacterium]